MGKEGTSQSQPEPDTLVMGGADTGGACATVGTSRKGTKFSSLCNTSET